MKTSLLLLTALLAALTITAQQNPAPEQPQPAKPDAGCIAAPPKPQPPPIRFKLPAKIQQALDKQKAEFERKTGIILPPPPPPGMPKPPVQKPCPPAAAPAPTTTKQ
jgi:hypothetical protein